MNPWKKSDVSDPPRCCLHFFEGWKGNGLDVVKKVTSKKTWRDSLKIFANSPKKNFRELHSLPAISFTSSTWNVKRKSRKRSIIEFHKFFSPFFRRRNKKNLKWKWNLILMFHHASLSSRRNMEEINFIRCVPSKVIFINFREHREWNRIFFDSNPRRV